MKLLNGEKRLVFEMKKILALIIGMTLFSSLWATAQVNQKSFDILLKTMLAESVPQITIPELAAKDLSKVVLLDAREKNEFQVSHLPNARWIGYETFDPSSVSDLNKSQEIVIYCSIGVRSEKIGEKLQKMGFTNVKNLYGSIFEWVNQGHAVVNPQGSETPEVHAYSKTWGIWLNKGEKVY